MKRSALQLRYLGAMGIDAWVRRDQIVQADEAFAALAESLPPEPAAPSMPAAGGADTAPHQDPARGAPHDLHALLDAPARSDPPESGRAPAPMAAPAPESSAAADRNDSNTVPRFRLRVLGLGHGLLLIDATALPDEAREALQRAGDLLRAGCLLRGLATEAPVESQIFHWPQVDDAQVDQSMPRAIEALCAFARRRADGGDGFLVVIDGPASDAGSAETDSGADARAPLEALDALPLPRARISHSFITSPDTATDRAAWRALLRLRAGGAARSTGTGAETGAGKAAQSDPRVGAATDV